MMNTDNSAPSRSDLRAYLEVGAREYQRDERDRVDTEVV